MIQALSKLFNSCYWITTGIEPPLRSSVKAAIFRLVQECLNNVEKHAEATTVQVKLEFLQESLSLVVKDDGVGFDLEKRMANGNSFGLLGMREQPAMSTIARAAIQIKRLFFIGINLPY